MPFFFSFFPAVLGMEPKATELSPLPSYHFLIEIEKMRMKQLAPEPSSPGLEIPSLNLGSLDLRPFPIFHQLCSAIT